MTDINLDKWAKDYAKERNTRLDAARKETGLKVPDLIAMSQGTDPFWMTKSKVLKAKWAEKIMNTIIIPHLRKIGVRDIHLRDIHYTLTSKDYKTWNGEDYQNTDKCWNDLIKAFSVARYLKFIDYSKIRDNKNIFNRRINYYSDDTYEDSIESARNNIDKESIIDDIFVKPFRSMLNTWNYQPVHIELWAEKDLALLEKISRKYSINAVVGEGETSVTMVYNLIDRIQESKRPVRIGYVSDCDVVGTNMVKAMARKVEYGLWQRGLTNDVKIIHLMTTPAQVLELGLPTTPMKVSSSQAYETRKENWLEVRNMTGAVEVNALHAQHPEYFEQTIVDFIQSYLDIDSWNDVVNYNKAIPQRIKDLVMKDFDLSAFNDIMDSIDWEELESDHEDKVTELDDADFDYKSNDDDYQWLFDTDREYGSQLVKYKEYDNGQL